MKIEILGAGCTNCGRLFDATVVAAKQGGIEAEVVKVEAIAEIVKRGVLITPSLVVNGRIVVSGRILKPADIATLLLDAAAAEGADD